MCLKYDEKARIAEYQYFRSDEAEEAERLGIDTELAALDAKLRSGGYVFHRACAILSFACVGSKRCRGHVLDQLKLQGSGISGKYGRQVTSLLCVPFHAANEYSLLFLPTVIKVGLNEFASLLSDGPQKTQIANYITEI